MLALITGVPLDVMTRRIMTDARGVLEYVAGVTALFVISALIWWMPLRSLRRRLAELAAITARIASGEFIAATQADEVRELAELTEGINEMSRRLERLVGGQKRFVADVAHELCSPLARLQMALGILEERVGLEPCAALREQATQLSELTQELLMFSRAAAGAAAPTRLVAVRLRELVERIAAREGGAAELAIDVPGDLVVTAHAALLGRAVANVVRNAVRYAAASGPIQLHAAATAPGRIDLVVADQGPGVPDEALAMLGNPFFRPELSRSRDSGGSGLGLAIVRTCVTACEGTVVFANRVDPTGRRIGFEVTIRLNAHA
jgi:two-component system sensor histidine kinase CpxA